MQKFIKENSEQIFEYINKEILKDIGIMHYNFFKKTIQDIITQKADLKINSNLLPYYIFTLIFNEGRIDYTSLRNETISFNQINKEASTYYNYAKFTLENDYLHLELKQCKIGGMPVDEDIVKFSRKIPVNYTGLEEFINKIKK